MLGQRCKYYPSCSNYAIGALREHGAVRGLGLAALAASALQPVQQRRLRPRAAAAPDCEHDHVDTRCERTCITCPSSSSSSCCCTGSSSRINDFLAGTRAGPQLDLGPRHHRPHHHRAPHPLPAHLEAVQVGAADAGHPAADQGTAEEVQERPRQAPGRDDEALPGAPGQPVRLVPAAAPAAAGLHQPVRRDQGPGTARSAPVPGLGRGAEPGPFLWIPHLGLPGPVLHPARSSTSSRS